jgi:multicomponent Na+:H+ antiporter subunit D
MTMGKAMFELIPPAIFMIVGALLIGPARGHLRTAILLAAPLVTLWFIWHVPNGVAYDIAFLDYRIEPLEGSELRRLFATIFALMAFVGGLYAFRQAKWYELSSAYAYAAGAIGVSFAGDLITLFLYWELMALFSTVVVWCGGTPQARRAGIRYAIMHLLGGVILKVGIEGVVVHTGSIDVRPMLAHNFDSWMILTGILINAAAPPVSAWLADSYPTSSPTGSVFLSAFTTKTAILALMLLFPGEPVLIGIGLFMVMYGIIYALLENDIRRILAYSIVNQVGFMVCAIGIGTQMALNGAAAHAFAHIIYKALLFMSAGVVVYRTGFNRCTEVGGLFRTMPLTAICGIIGKFPWFVFFQRDSGLRPKDAPWNMGAAMVIFSILCILLGVAPDLLYRFLPYPVEYEAYTPGKVLFYLQLLMFSGLAFFLLLPLMKRTETISLDTDWLWRVLLFKLAVSGYRLATAAGNAVSSAASTALLQLRNIAQRYLGSSSQQPRPGVFTRAWPIGVTAMWIAVLLTAYVLVYYF